jgi:aminoglycoside phosphotransferase (APT) family kinase protein
VDVDLSSLTPLEGGWSGHTFLAEVAGERSVVRIYPPGDRGPAAAEVDAAVLRLVRGLVPVPEVLEVRPAVPETDQPGVLVTSFLPGTPGDELLPTLDPAALARVGATLGGLLGDLGGMPMLRPGPFVDPDLAIGDFGVDGLPAYVEDRLPELGHLSPEEIDGLREVAVEAQVLLDTVTRTCLVHSDLNPKNLLLDPETLALTAVLDWEFAHAGHPCTDLGNLLRFDREPAFVEAVLGAYAERRGTPPDLALALGRAADLWALVDLATRRSAHPVAARADRLLRAIVRERDPGVPAPA